MSKLQIKVLLVGAVRTNCYIIYREDGSDCIIIDPGADPERIQDYLNKFHLSPQAILLTHGHFDHILGTKELCSEMSIPVYAHEEEKALLLNAQMNCTEFGTGTAFTMDADRYVTQGEVLSWGALSCQVIHTPGHTQGGCCYYFEEEGILFSGDTLFRSSIGRTDFPTGNSQRLLQSVEEKLFSLPENVVVYSGHGPSTTIKYEKEENPFF